MSIQIPIKNSNINLGSIGEYIIQLKCSENGYLSLFKAKINEELKLIINDSTCPLNRDSFSFCDINEDSFIISGGVGVGILTFEVWKFTFSTNSWKLLKNIGNNLKRRQNHCSSSYFFNNKTYIYIYGGTKALSFYDNLLILIIENDSYDSISIIFEKDFPNLRIHHTMTYYNSQIYLYGGIGENGQLFSELWSLDLSLFPERPTWEKIINTGPPLRYSHVAYMDGDHFCIAGGLNSSKKYLNDIWRFRTKWQQSHIFETNNSYYPCLTNLYDISNKVILINTRSPFAALDSIFSELREKQIDYTKRSEQLKKKSNILLNNSKNVSELCSILTEYHEDSKNTNITPCLDQFSKSSTQMLVNKVSNLKNKLNNSAERISNFLNNLKDSNLNFKQNLIIPIVAEQLTLKLKEHEIRFNEIKTNLDLEIQLYNQQIEILENLLGSNYKLPNLDIINFNSYKDYIKDMNKNDQNLILSYYYNLQLTEYNSIISKNNNLKSFSRLNQSQLTQKHDIINKISKLLTKHYNKMRKIEIEIDEWKEIYQSLQYDISITNSFVQEINYCSENKKIFTKKDVDEIEFVNIESKQLLSNELKNFVLNHKDTITALYQKTLDLLESINEVNDSEIKNIVQQAAPSLIGLKDQLIKNDSE